ncbi:response regulator [Chitinophagaceae bacterium MMS25-I14]
MPKAVNIFLIDDHVIVRNALKGLIERLGNYRIVAEYNNGKELIDDIPFAEEPQLMVMDLNMPEMDGKETMQWLKEHNYNYPVLVLTLDTGDKTIIELFKLGVRGYLPKHCTSEVLSKAINDVLTTGYHHNELLARAIFSDQLAPHKDERQEVMEKITEREIQFLQLVCDEAEYTYDKIAEKMNVHRRTIDGYRESLFEKFNIKSKTGLVLFAIKYGIYVLKMPGMV